MLIFTVIHQAFAVIGQKHDERTIVDAERFQLLNQSADDRVGLRDLAVIRRVVRRVRLVDVKKEEERLRRIFLDPGVRDLQRLEARSLMLADRAGGRHCDAIVVEIEAVLDAGFAAQNVRRHRCTAAIAVFAKRLLKRRKSRAVEAIADVVAHFMLGRQQSGEDRHVRRQRHRAVAVRALEQHGVSAQRIEVRRFNTAISVRRQVIRPQRVDGDQDHRRVPEGLLAVTSSEEQKEERAPSHMIGRHYAARKNI